jgi:hypothetical protein
MTKRNRKATLAEAEAPRRRGRPAKSETAESELSAGHEEREDREDREDEDFEDAGFNVISDARAPQEPDPREVENLTDRIFGSVLSRYGWERHGDRIEHIGGQQPRDRHR